MGCNIGQVGLTHDQLDAALCVALRWRLFHVTGLWTAELVPADANVPQGLAVFRDAE